MEEKMKIKCKNCKFDKLRCGTIVGICHDGSKFEPIEKEYRVVKEFPTCNGFLRVGDILKFHDGIKKYIDQNDLRYSKDLVENNPKWFWFEEAKEEEKDTLESILEGCNDSCGTYKMYNRIINWHNKDVAKRGIALLEELKSRVNKIGLAGFSMITNEIKSELEKEITDGSKKSNM